jgi:hypothetical protein
MRKKKKKKKKKGGGGHVLLCLPPLCGPADPADAHGVPGGGGRQRAEGADREAEGKARIAAASVLPPRKHLDKQKMRKKIILVRVFWGVTGCRDHVAAGPKDLCSENCIF